MAGDKVALAVVFLAICVATIEGARCYVCTVSSSGGEKNKCLDPSMLTSSDSDMIQDCTGILNGCMKTKTVLGGTTTIARTCGIAEDKCEDKSEGGNSVEICLCGGDLCNNAQVKKSSIFIIFAASLALLAYFF